MMDRSKLVVVLALVLAAVSPMRVEAQVAEVSVGIGGAEVQSGGDFWTTRLHSPALETRANVRLTDRFSIEPFVTVGHRSIAATEYAPYAIGGDTQRTEGMYGVVLHQRLSGLTRPGFHAYMSYGLNGLYFTEKAPERQFVYGRTATYTRPAWTRSEHDGMFFPSVGFGVRKSLGKHLAVRADADVIAFLVIPVGVRASMGVVVPFGGKR